jgi:VWFA-related protein
MSTRLNALLLFAVTSWTLEAGLTPAAQQQPVFRVGVEAVVLDVSVLGRDGMPVRGLTAADFTVLEDGTPQRISTFSAVDLPDVGRAVAGWLRDGPRDTAGNEELADGVVLVILLDDANPNALPRLVRSCARLVIEGLGPHDLAAVVFLASKRSGQEFTYDRSRLLAAVERYQGGGGHALSELAPRMLVDMLEDLADGLSALPARRKAIVYVATGLPIDVGSLMPDSLVPEKILKAHEKGEFVGRLLRVFDRARRANVNVYCLDPRGLSPSASSAAQDFLRILSDNTGGFTITDTNQAQPGVAQIFRENSSYYVLGYQPSNQRAEGRFRKITVRVNRPDLTVRTRSGHMEPTGARPAAAKKALDPLVGAISGFLPRTGVSMRVSAAPVALSTRKRAALAVVVGLQHAGETPALRATGATPPPEEIDVLVNAYDMAGDLKGSERLHARVPYRAEAAEHDSCELLSRLDLNPGRYHLRVAANMRGRTGSVYYDVEVPDFAGAALSLSGVAVTAAAAAPSSPNSRLAAVMPVVPTSRRDFTAADRVSAFLRVYQGGSHALVPVTIRARIVDSLNTEIFESVRALDVALFDSRRAADYRLDLPLAGMRPGPHLLTLEATMGKRVDLRGVRFTVR